MVKNSSGNSSRYYAKKITIGFFYNFLTFSYFLTTELSLTLLYSKIGLFYEIFKKKFFRIFR